MISSLYAIYIECSSIYNFIKSIIGSSIKLINLSLIGSFKFFIISLNAYYASIAFYNGVFGIFNNEHKW